MAIYPHTFYLFPSTYHYHHRLNAKEQHHIQQWMQSNAFSHLRVFESQENTFTLWVDQLQKQFPKRVHNTILAQHQRSRLKWDHVQHQLKQHNNAFRTQLRKRFHKQHHKHQSLQKNIRSNQTLQL